MGRLMLRHTLFREHPAHCSLDVALRRHAPFLFRVNEQLRQDLIRGALLIVVVVTALGRSLDLLGFCRVRSVINYFLETLVKCVTPDVALAEVIHTRVVAILVRLLRLRYEPTILERIIGVLTRGLVRERKLRV